MHDPAAFSVVPGTICLVEDHALLRDQLVGLLTDAGHRVVAAVGTKAEGLAAVTEHRPKLAVIDHRLPDGLGLDLCRSLKVRLPEVRVVLHSGTIDEALVRAGLAAGAVAVVAKSIRGTALLEAVAAHSA